MRTKIHTVTAIALLVCLTVSSPSAAQENIIPSADLLMDLKQLTVILETAHPDPYSRGGGKVAFHRRLQTLHTHIPNQGMTGKQFARLLLPFVGSVGDSHTGLQLDGAASPFNQSSGMPLLFRLVERSLYVYGANDKQYEEWFGAHLKSVENVSVDELLQRQRGLRGIENWVHNLTLLGLGLSSESWLTLLVPEWVDHSKLTMEIQKPGHSTQVVEFQVSGQSQRAPYIAPSQITLPSTKHAEVAWGFHEENRDIAILRVDGMEGYREAFESYIAQGVTNLDEQAREAYERYRGKSAPQDMSAVVAGLPSASDAFARLVTALNEAGTRTLIVDLRRNTGGNSIMKEILVYFLYGNRALEAMDDGYQIVKMSPLYFEMYSNESLEQINLGRSQSLGAEDYDFSQEEAYRGNNMAHLVTERTHSLSRIPSFLKWFKTGDYHQPRHKLTNVIVLSSPFTYSSGFNMMQSLLAQDALLVGTPSAQSANNFGDSLVTQLPHSGVTVFVSHKVNIGHPSYPAMGQITQPDHPLTWERWAAWNFDPNAEVLYALELIEKTQGE